MVHMPQSGQQVWGSNPSICNPSPFPKVVPPPLPHIKKKKVTNNKMVKCTVSKIRNNCDDFELAQNVGCKYDIAFKDCFRNR